MYYPESHVKSKLLLYPTKDSSCSSEPVYRKNGRSWKGRTLLGQHVAGHPWSLGSPRGHIHTMCGESHVPLVSPPTAPPGPLSTTPYPILLPPLPSICDSSFFTLRHLPVRLLFHIPTGDQFVSGDVGGHPDTLLHVTLGRVYAETRSRP